MVIKTRIHHCFIGFFSDFHRFGHFWDPEGGHGVPPGSAPSPPPPLPRAPPHPTTALSVPAARHGAVVHGQPRVRQASFGFNMVATLTARADSGGTVVTTVVTTVVSAVVS